MRAGGLIDLPSGSRTFPFAINLSATGALPLGAPYVAAKSPSVTFLDIRPQFSYKITNLAPLKGRQPVTPAGGARAAPAGGGSSLPPPGGSGEIRPAGITTGLRETCWTGTGEDAGNT